MKEIGRERDIEGEGKERDFESEEGKETKKQIWRALSR